MTLNFGMPSPSRAGGNYYFYRAVCLPDQNRENRVLPFILPNHAVVMPKAANAAGNEIDRENQEGQRDREERCQPVKHAAGLIKIRGRDQHAQHRERKREDRDAGAQT